MKANNSLTPEQEKQRGDIDAFLDRADMLGQVGTPSATILPVVIDCIASMRQLAKTMLSLSSKDYAPGYRFWMVERVLKIFKYLPSSNQISQTLLKDGFSWLESGNDFNYHDLKFNSLLFAWLQKHHPEAIDPMRTRFSKGVPEAEFTDHELSQFYSDNAHRIQKTLIHEILPSNLMYFPDPFSKPDSRIFFEYYKMLLTVSSGERELPKDESLLKN